MQTLVQEKAYEFALFKLKPELADKYKFNLNYFYEHIKTFDGFNRLITYKNINDELMFLDFAQWDSIEAASEADKRVQTDALCNQFFEPLDFVVHFDNCKILERLQKDFETENVFEISIYKVDEDDVDEMKKHRSSFFKRVFNNLPELLEVAHYQSLINVDVFIDVLKWSDIYKADRNHKKYNEDKDFVAFKKKMKSFEHFMQFKKYGEKNA